jgi:hypothetical protein
VITGDDRVAAYIAATAATRRPALEAIRDLCRTHLTGMPGYVRDDVVEVGFADQKRYISLYILRTDVLAAHRAALAGLSLGKGCVRYGRPDQLDASVVRDMLVMTAGSRGPVC